MSSQYDGLGSFRAPSIITQSFHTRDCLPLVPPWDEDMSGCLLSRLPEPPTLCLRLGSCVGIGGPRRLQSINQCGKGYCSLRQSCRRRTQSQDRVWESSRLWNQFNKLENILSPLLSQQKYLIILYYCSFQEIFEVFVARFICSRRRRWCCQFVRKIKSSGDKDVGGRYSRLTYSLTYVI